MNETLNNTTMTAMNDNTKTLRGIHRAIRRTQLHLNAYSEETTPTNINNDNVPDTDYYDLEADRQSTKQLQATVTAILTHMEQQPGHPAYEDATADTTQSWAGCTRRLYNLVEAIVWTIVARDLAATLTDAAPELNQLVERLAEDIDAHGEEYSPFGGIGVGELDQAARLLAAEG